MPGCKSVILSAVAAAMLAMTTSAAPVASDAPHHVAARQGQPIDLSGWDTQMLAQAALAQQQEYNIYHPNEPLPGAYAAAPGSGMGTIGVTYGSPITGAAGQGAAANTGAGSPSAMTTPQQSQASPFGATQQQTNTQQSNSLAMVPGVTPGTGQSATTVSGTPSSSSGLGAATSNTNTGAGSSVAVGQTQQQTPGSPGFPVSDAACADYQPLATTIIQKYGVSGAAQWFSTPDATSYPDITACAKYLLQKQGAVIP